MNRFKFQARGIIFTLALLFGSQLLLRNGHAQQLVVLQSMDKDFKDQYLDFRGGGGKPTKASNDAQLSKNLTGGSKWWLVPQADGSFQLQSADLGRSNYYLTIDANAKLKDNMYNVEISKVDTGKLCRWKLHRFGNGGFGLESLDESFQGWFLDFRGGKQDPTDVIVFKGLSPGANWKMSVTQP